MAIRLQTMFRGHLVGTDAEGNRYYEDKRPRPDGVRARRWVIYNGGIEDASRVPAEWHAWLHYTTDAPLERLHRPWIKPHEPNATGTPASYRPPGHDYRGGHRSPATGDYEAWTPGG